MRFEVYGPFEVPRVDGVVSKADRDRMKHFWDEVEASDEGLSTATGIYVFSSRHGEKYTPWYVGKTNSKQGFRGEVLQDHKVTHYMKAGELKRGVPCLHLVPRLTAGSLRFSRASAAGGQEIDLLETAMIAMALRANADVRNDRKTWFNKNCLVPGIMGQASRGRRPESARSLRAAFRLDGS